MNKEYPLSRFVADRVKVIRKEKRISQEALSEMAGLDVKYINKLENYRMSPRFETLESILKCLDMTYSEFFNFNIQTNKNDVEILINRLAHLPQDKQSKKIKAIIELLEE
ncbi:helix-turn-helix domain-containing protein [Streptococcus thoraltensis]|uniref:helix-turn-helix domain-containing protein n=1 Tax=Streptococcus thoraltensis TaxID=55085 RepID=UPI001F57621E|nr:helix-turn-helix transcriptional regulator [Streptococcus thoraltensis]